MTSPKFKRRRKAPPLKFGACRYGERDKPKGFDIAVGSV
ncbi:hypothetical protein APA_5198 [Pseudanabaena sp. lw0831]|nr:hypothetical protein APA_5198 [Pseudanabaena sp. lw0831]